MILIPMHQHTAISARENTASHQQSLALRLADYYNEKRFLDSKCIKAFGDPITELSQMA